MEDNIEIKEGSCFGWFSNVNKNCQSSSCVLSERCKGHTILQQDIILNDEDKTLPTNAFDHVDKKSRSSVIEKVKEKMKKKREKEKKEAEMKKTIIKIAKEEREAKRKSLFTDLFNKLTEVIPHENVIVKDDVFTLKKGEVNSKEFDDRPKSRLDHATKKVAKVHFGFSCT